MQSNPLVFIDSLFWKNLHSFFPRAILHFRFIFVPAPFFTIEFMHKFSLELNIAVLGL